MHNIWFFVPYLVFVKVLVFVLFCHLPLFQLVSLVLGFVLADVFSPY